MVKCFMGWWSKVWWHLTCYWRGILVFVVLALFLDGMVSAPFSPLLCLQLHSTGSAGLCRPLLCSARGFSLPSHPTSSCLLLNKNCLNLVYVTTHFNAYHTSFIRVSVFTFLWLPSYQSLFCVSRTKMEIVHIFNFILYFSPRHWDSQYMLMKVLNFTIEI